MAFKGLPEMQGGLGMSEYDIKKADHGRMFVCPGCGVMGKIDQDQYEGRVSIQCPECDFYEIINLKDLED